MLAYQMMLVRVGAFSGFLFSDRWYQRLIS
jgi:hypothetical protein